MFNHVSKAYKTSINRLIWNERNVILLSKNFTSRHNEHVGFNFWLNFYKNSVKH